MCDAQYNDKQIKNSWKYGKYLMLFNFNLSLLTGTTITAVAT